MTFLTLEQVRKVLDTERRSGVKARVWSNLMSKLGNPDAPDMLMTVSLGDIARACGASDALRFVIDRRLALSLILPTIERSLRYTELECVHDCIAAIGRWIAGDGDVDLRAARDSARAVLSVDRVAYDFNDTADKNAPTEADRTAVDAVADAATFALADNSSVDYVYDEDEEEYFDYNEESGCYIPRVTPHGIARILAKTTIERQLQIADIVAFSPLHSVKHLAPVHLTLQEIQKANPSREGWARLMEALGNPSDLSMKISLGDVALANGSDAALWCLIRCRHDANYMVAWLMPALERLAYSFRDSDIIDTGYAHECVDAIREWAGRPGVGPAIRAVSSLVYLSKEICSNNIGKEMALDALLKVAQRIAFNTPLEELAQVLKLAASAAGARVMDCYEDNYKYERQTQVDDILATSLPLVLEDTRERVGGPWELGHEGFHDPADQQLTWE